MSVLPTSWLIYDDDRKRRSTPTTPDAPREMKSTSNYANQLRKKPRELVLTLNTFASLSVNSVKGKDGMVGVRGFSVVQAYLWTTLCLRVLFQILFHFLSHELVIALNEAFCRLICLWVYEHP